MEQSAEAVGRCEKGCSYRIFHGDTSNCLVRPTPTFLLFGRREIDLKPLKPHAFDGLSTYFVPRLRSRPTSFLVPRRQTSAPFSPLSTEVI